MKPTKPTLLQRLRKLGSDESGQGVVEMVVVTGIVIVGLVWMVTALPNAIKHHFDQNQKILAAPL
jgi:Flp pilus assembly pilin Flp